jgi:hypothetical protein
MQAEAGQRRRWPFWFLIATLSALILAVGPGALGHPTPLTADPHLYSEAMERLFAGGIPYVDFPFEHLPLAIGPMAAAHIVAAPTGIAYGNPFIIVMLGIIFVSGVLVVRIGDELELEGVGLRWVVMMAPMLLIAPFRIDALSVMLAVAAVYLAMTSRQGASLGAAMGAILAKGWPVVLAVPDWWRGERRRAIGLVAFTMAVAALLLATPGFREGRSFVGVHQETLSGTVVIVWRLVSGSGAGIVNSAGAVYVETGVWAAAFNLLVGASIALAALTVLRRTFSWRGGIALTGALTYAVLLASPLLSTQFLLWPIPFVALTGSRPGRWLLTAAAAFSVALTGIWLPGTLWWHVGWLGRNLLLVAAAVYGVRDAIAVARYEESTSLKNLPV